MTDLDKYIAENDYSGWSQEAWLQAEALWGTYPEDSEEYRQLRILRKQLERKRADEEAYQKYCRLQEQRARNRENDKKFESMLCFDQIQEQKFLLSLDTSYPTFKEVFDSLKVQKGFKTDKEVCDRANLTPDILTKIKNETNYTVQRDYLWAIAIGLGLNWEETNRLFNACSLSPIGAYHFDSHAMKRERALEFFIHNQMSIKEANKELKDHGMYKLGNADNGIEEY